MWRRPWEVCSKSCAMQFSGTCKSDEKPSVVWRTERTDSQSQPRHRAKTQDIDKNEFDNENSREARQRCLYAEGEQSECRHRRRPRRRSTLGWNARLPRSRQGSMIPSNAEHVPNVVLQGSPGEQGANVPSVKPRGSHCILHGLRMRRC